MLEGVLKVGVRAAGAPPASGVSILGMLEGVLKVGLLGCEVYPGL